ncbi:MAG: YfhO family protein, partial [Chloroflexi bacterium]|nr:YfhO family protein [Chloroflexota bacterium]
MRRAADRGFWVPLLLAAVSAVFFWKVLFLGRAIGGLDVIDYFAPYRQYAQQAIDSGQLPLWNPDIFGGVPFLANIQSALFYPPTGLFYVLDEPWAYTANLVIHAFLAALFTYLFLRQSVHLGRCGALSGAIIFAFGGFMGGQSGHLNQFSAATWLPALLLCWDKAAARRLGYVLLGGLVVTLQFLAGHSQESYLMLVAMAFYAASTTILDIRREGWAHLPVRGLTFVVMLALGGGLAAIQLVPTSELTSWSIRANGLSYADATTFSLKPTMLLEALLPPFANRALLLEPGGTEFLGYAGAVGLVLAAAGLVYGRRRHAMIFGLLAAGAVLLAFGKENPAFPLLFKIVPGFNLFRVPARWLFLASFGVAVLAGAGADALGGVAPARDWRPLAIILGGCGALAAAMSWSQALPPRTTTAFWIVFGLLGVLVAFFALTLNRRRSPAVTPRRPPPG